MELFDFRLVAGVATLNKNFDARRDDIFDQVYTLSRISNLEISWKLKYVAVYRGP